MVPVVMIERTPAGDAFRYHRFGATRRGTPPVSTDVVDMPQAKVGDPLEAMAPEHVEWLRTDPKTFLQ